MDYEYHLQKYAGPGDRWYNARGWCAFTTPGTTGALPSGKRRLFDSIERLEQGARYIMRAGAWRRLTAYEAYSFFSSIAGFVFAAFNVCHSTVPKAMASEMMTATTNTHP